MKLPQKDDLVGEDAGPRPERYILQIARDVDDIGDDRVAVALRGTRTKTWWAMETFLRAYRWSEDHILGGGWVRR